METKSTLSCFSKKNTYLISNTFYLPPSTMIDTDTFIEQMIIKVIPDIDGEGLDMMIEETKPVLYDRVITHIVDEINEKDSHWLLDALEENGVTPEVAEYLKSKIPNFPEFLEKVYNDFETMYLKEFKAFEKEFKKEE